MSENLLIDIIEENNIKLIDSNHNYWFVRTQGGKYFDDFHFSDYIAIEWDEISDITWIEGATTDEIKREVALKYPEESRAGLVAGQIVHFVKNMKKDDIVLIPNKNSEYITFGIIEDDKAYKYTPTFEEVALSEDDEEMKLFKRRKVKWLMTKKRDYLDPYLYRIIYSHNTIVNANAYSTFIDRTMYDMFYKNNALHAVFQVKKTEDIPAMGLMGFINNTVEYIQTYTGESVEDKDLSIRATINSPGPIEFIGYSVGVAIGLSSLGIFLAGGKLSLKNKIKHNETVDSATELTTESDGIIDRIRQFRESDTASKIAIAESKIQESKQLLKLDNRKEG